ncbi:MAG: hypothetical protein B6A08_01500 [Sorangiineae bacterium NIC37A_2]|nr:MAG: hypothetical protein B6A08_01500 [Sorangiineae bacterium NIC37A_2]
MRLNSRPLHFLLDRGRRTLLLSLLPLSVTFGCLGMRVGGSQDDDSSMGGAKADPRPDVEPGSCNGWKVSYCDAVKTCQSSQAAERCKATVGYVRCLDDAPVGRCAKEIDKTVASEKCALPEDCHPGDIADRRQAVAACRDLYQAACEWGFFCGFYLSEDSCRVQFEFQQTCSEALAVLPDAEKCLRAYQTLGCFEPLPAECPGIFFE